MNQALELVLTINWSTMVSYETIFQILSTFQMGAVCFFSCINDATIFIVCTSMCYSAVYCGHLLPMDSSCFINLIAAGPFLDQSFE